MGYKQFLPLQEFYNFGGFKICEGFVTDGQVLVRLKRTWKTGICPSCGNKKRGTRVEEEYGREVRDLPIFGRKVTVCFRQYKIQCRRCGYRGMEKLDGFIERYSGFTVRFEEYVARMCEITCLKNVSKMAEMDWKAVKRIDKKYLKRKCPGLAEATPERMGVDEVAYEKGHKYLTVVRDADRHRVIWVGEERKKETLDRFFLELGETKTAEIRAAVTDMWDPYIASIEEHCPQADIVFDKFHVSKKVNEALDKIRREEFASAGEGERKRMKHKRFLMLKRGDKLDRDERERLGALMCKNKKLYKAYLLKEQLADILDEKEPEFALARLKKWFANIGRSRIPQYRKVASTIKNYLYGIVNYFKHGLTNAASEAFNNKIGLLKRIAYGYRDLEYFKLKIINCCWKSS